MPYDVQFLSVPETITAVVRRCARQNELSSVVPKACGEVWNYVKATGLKGGRHIAYYVCGDANGLNVEIGVELPEPFESDGGELVCSKTPAGNVATTVHIGPYNLLGNAHSAVLAECRAKDLTLAGPSWEIYGHWTDNPRELRTDVFYLIDS